MVSYVSIPQLSKCIETMGPVSKFIVSTSIAIACSTTYRDKVWEPMYRYIYIYTIRGVDYGEALSQWVAMWRIHSCPEYCHGL